MNKLKMSEVRDNISEVGKRVAYAGERFTVSSYKTEVFAIVSMEDLRVLEALENESDLIAAREALAESGERIPYSQIRQKFGLKKK